MPFPKGHAKAGGKRKGFKESLETTVSTDILYAYKKMGGKTALLEWGESNKDEFFKFLKQNMANRKTSGNDKDIRFVEDLRK